jgi:hypothetical protein
MENQKVKNLIACTVLISFTLCVAEGILAEDKDECLLVPTDSPELSIDPSALAALKKANMLREDFFKALRIVSRYETNGCWAGATGNFDGQLLSVGVMQWNFGRGSLQPILKRFSEKFSSPSYFIKIRDDLMPNYGKQLFDISCRTIPIGKDCSSFLANMREGKNGNLKKPLKQEIDNLFNSEIMRQIQLDYFARSVTSVLSDLDRVYGTSQPKGWQVAWAVDIKTQQGDKFPTDKNIQRIKLHTASDAPDKRVTYVNGVVKWYEGLCESDLSDGVKYDWLYNIKTWGALASALVKETDREEALHYTFLVSKTAANQNGAYQANAFQRRATIVFGQGSVNGTIIKFNTLPSSQASQDKQKP